VAAVLVLLLLAVIVVAVAAPDGIDLGGWPDELRELLPQRIDDELDERLPEVPDDVMR